MYTQRNYTTLADVIFWVDAAAQDDAIAAVRVIPGPDGVKVTDGEVDIEGPHYPAKSTWWATCRVEDGEIVPGTIQAASIFKNGSGIYFPPKG
jgi:hypothetical protein